MTDKEFTRKHDALLRDQHNSPEAVERGLRDLELRAAMEEAPDGRIIAASARFGGAL